MDETRDIWGETKHDLVCICVKRGVGFSCIMKLLPVLFIASTIANFYTFPYHSNNENFQAALAPKAAFNITFQCINTDNNTCNLALY